MTQSWADWFAGKTFSTDFSSRCFDIWLRCLAPFAHDIRSVLEIGSWEGRSAVFFAEWLPAATITCIDVFDSGPALYAGTEFANEVPRIEARFDANTRAYGERVRKMRMTSAEALAALNRDGEHFDLVFIDGNHDRDAVLVDSFLAWSLLSANGFLIWDDYGYGEGLADERRPRTAIDTFVRLHAPDMRVLQRRGQFIVQRSKDPTSP